MRTLGALQAGSRRRAERFNPNVLLDALVVYDHQHIDSLGWAPSIDQHAMGVVTGAGIITPNWLGSGKSIRNYGGNADCYNPTYNQPARTWAWVGMIGATPGNGSGITSAADGGSKIFPFYWGTASGGSIGVDFRNGGNNRDLFTGINALRGHPFVLAVSAVANNEFRGHLRCNGASLDGLNTTAIAGILNLVGGMSIGGWFGGGGTWTDGVAAVAAYKLPVPSGAPGAAVLQELTGYWAAPYGPSNF